MEIIFFKTTEQKRSPVWEFVDSLDTRAKAKVLGTLRGLREYGGRVVNTHSKKLSGTPLWELRWLGKHNVRLLYIPIGDSFLILHGFEKKQEKTPKKEIVTAMRRMNSYLVQ